MAIKAQRNWLIFQLEFKIAFLNKDFPEEVYVNQPDGFVVKGKEHLSLYRRIDQEIIQEYTRCSFPLINPI